MSWEETEAGSASTSGAAGAREAHVNFNGLPGPPNPSSRHATLGQVPTEHLGKDQADTGGDHRDETGVNGLRCLSRKATTRKPNEVTEK